MMGCRSIRIHLCISHYLSSSLALSHFLLFFVLFLEGAFLLFSRLIVSHHAFFRPPHHNFDIPRLRPHGSLGKGDVLRGGPDPAVDNQNTNTAVDPLYGLNKEDWWFQHERGCDAVPPPPGEFLFLPANGNFTVELAHNRAKTTLSYDGRFTTAWPDGENHPDDWNSWEGPGSPCLKTSGGDGPLHTYNETNAAGTAWAISYESDIKKVSMENLVVFSVLKHTPWKRLATYRVPNLPKCPEGGCTCAWLWVPEGCGQPNMYMQGFKCNVTGATNTRRVAKANAPVYCADDKSKCVPGAKQMIAWNQATGNNIVTPDVWGVAPGYNEKCGWTDGPQRDIFE